jgi:hypothetical protein
LKNNKVGIVDNGLHERKNLGGSYDEIIQYNLAGTGVGYSRSGGLGSAYTGTSISGYSFGRKRFHENE